MRQQIAAKISQVVSAHNQIVNHCQGLDRLVSGNAIDNSHQDVSSGDAERQLHVFLLDLFAREADYLIESRLRIAHRTVAGAGDLAQCIFGD